MTAFATHVVEMSSPTAHAPFSFANVSLLAITAIALATYHPLHGRYCAQGQAVGHAIIDRLPRFQRASVLHFGNDDCAVLDALTVDSRRLAYVAANDAITLQLDERFDLVVIGTQTLAANNDGHRRAVMHAAMQHVDRGGHLIVLHEAAQPALVEVVWANDLHLLGSYPLAVATLSLYRRGDRTTVHDLLFEARATIARVSPSRLAERIRAADGTLVLDTRTHTDRDRFGVIPGAVHVPRTVLEWHFDPANGYLHPAMRSFAQPLVLVCNGGYSSSLAAANLVRLGFTNVADLIGGHAAWAAAGLPVERPDHSHLDTPGFDEQGFNEERRVHLPMAPATASAKCARFEAIVEQRGPFSYR